MAYLSSQLQTLEYGNSEFIPAFQISIYRYGIHVLHANEIKTCTWFYVNKIIILEVRKAKMNWLRCKRDPAEGDSRKDRNCYLEQ